MSTLSKKPKERIRSAVCLILLAENGSPSAARNCLRITLSKVAVFPVTFIRSRMTLGPRSIKYLTLRDSDERFFVILGCIVKKIRSFFRARRSKRSISKSTICLEYVAPFSTFKILKYSSASTPFKSVSTDTSPTRNC